jgi:hypothetical protein
MKQGEMFSKPKRFTELPGAGYAATPGMGPKGETCDTCVNCRKIRGRGNYNKCALVKRSWTKETDIRLDAPACVHWQRSR